jgi:hypothetical protein
MWKKQRYFHLKEEALDCTKWRSHFGRGFGPVVWQITDDDDVHPPLLHVENGSRSIFHNIMFLAFLEY